MAHIFKYAILMAIPDRLRGERVNVGIIVFRPESLDIRFTELSKIRALVGGEWNIYSDNLKRRLIERLGAGDGAEEMVRAAPQIDPIFRASEVSWLSIKTLDEYEGTINEILTNVVMRPKKEEVRVKSTRINTEISRQLKTYNILAKRGDPIVDHRVHRDYFVSEDEKLIADFAIKNGSMHIFATLDLRRPHVRLDEAALKAITLNKAKERFRKKAKRLGVYAALEVDGMYKPHIQLLKDYSDKTYNWANPEDQWSLLSVIRTATSQPFEFGRKAS